MMRSEATCPELRNSVTGSGAHCRQRRGISLLEVLISMFILLFGLMGVASMFPAGQWHVSKASRYDRAAAVGEAAFNDLQVRGMLLQEAYPVADRPQPPYVVDPAGSPVWIISSEMPPPDIATQQLGVFWSRDDLSVEFPSDGDKSSFLFPSTVQRQYDGHFSWLYMVTRNPEAPAEQNMCDVSVVVFYKRDVNFPNNGETNVSLTPLSDMSDSMGGGEITFTATSNTTPEQVRPGNWLMLSGYTDLGKWLGGWYRITASDATTSQYAISCVGPDWGALKSLDGVNMTLFDSAVAVYQKTMNLEQGSPWSFAQ